MLTVSATAADWTATWATAPEKAGKKEMPQNSRLGGGALRQVVHASLGGKELRFRLSNEYSSEPIEIKSAYIADTQGGAEIDSSSAKYLKFDGKDGVTIAPGKTVYSDPVKFDLQPLQLLSITLNYGTVPETGATTHRGSRTTSYIMEGHQSKPGEKFNATDKVEHWYTISSLDVLTDGAECFGIVGDSITDGRGSTTDCQDRWTDVMAESLGGNVGVLNLGIGGNCVIQGGLGIPASERFDNDILTQAGLTAVIVGGGVNDIGGSKNSEKTARQLIRAYKEMIRKCRERGLKVYGATITPIGGTDYWSLFHEAARQTVNDWIRTSGEFDGVIDFDKTVADTEAAPSLRRDYQYDSLHPNADGYRAMGQAAAQSVKTK